MKSTNPYLADMPTTIFATMSALANEHGAINLGQGFPDTDGPLWVREIAAKELTEGYNQYPPLTGVQALRDAISADNKRFYGLEIDPLYEVLVTSGATEALNCSFQALIEPGDEAIIIEPFYDCYKPQIELAGGTIKYLRLNPPEWSFTREDLESVFSEKTKLIALNSPLNPAAKVFSFEELQLIAEMLIKYDAYAVCDEVYEHLLFDNLDHIPLMTLPGMKDRCIRIGSAGKTFSLTGWKIGYITAPAPLIKAIASSHQFTTFTTPPNLQVAVAEGLKAGDEYYEALTAQMDEGRQILSEGLKNLGFTVLPCAGTYFLTVDYSPIADKLGFSGTDYEFCVWLNKEAKVTGIPMSPFYADETTAPPKTLMRLCFAKKPEVLRAALDNLEKFLN